MCVLLLLKAVTVVNREHRRCKGFCDNEGVIFHSNKPSEKVKLDQSSDDLVRICKELLRGLPMKVYFGYVRGHAYRHTPFARLTLLSTAAERHSGQVGTRGAGAIPRT